jgi:hypothetical protein
MVLVQSSSSVAKAAMATWAASVPIDTLRRVLSGGDPTDGPAADKASHIRNHQSRCLVTVLGHVEDRAVGVEDEEAAQPPLLVC